MDICIRSHLPVLIRLNLQANPLMSLSSEDLKPLRNVDIRFLLMTGTHIENLPPDILKYIPRVKDITIKSDSRYPTGYKLCLASPANFIYGRVLAKVLSHVTIMPVLLRPVNNFLGQVIGNASEGKYNTVNSSSSGE